MERRGVTAQPPPETVEVRRARVEQEIAAWYPDLRVTADGEDVVLRGTFSVEHEGDILERYLVEVVIPRRFPDEVPAAREIGGRIPHLADRHVYTNGVLCVLVPEDWFLYPDHTVLGYLDGPLRNFFIGDALVARGLPRPFGERAHNVWGLLEAYGEIVDSTDPLAIRRYLEYLGKETVKGHWECPCGSGRRLRNCHGEHLRALRDRVPQWVARSAGERLQRHMILEMRRRTP